MASHPGSDVLIAGGGVAALEGLLALRAQAGQAAVITLLAAESDFVLRASAVVEPFSRGHARRVPLREIVEDHGAHLEVGVLAAVEPERHLAMTADGRELHYDRLLVALGALQADPFPGATVFRASDGDPAFLEVLAQAVAGEHGALAFVVPPGASWALPLYELALLTSMHLAEHGAPPVELSIVTPEKHPLEIFGRRAADEVERLLEQAQISLRTLSRARALEGGRLSLEGGGAVHADRAVSLPTLVGPKLPGLPAAGLGFIPVAEHGRVGGLADVFAAGDCTSFPVKQGGIAAQQADAAAAAIAASLGLLTDPPPFRPVLRGLLLTGSSPRYFRAEPGAGREPASVAIDAPAPDARFSGEGISTRSALWWPPSKVAGSHLGFWLGRPRGTGDGELEDRFVRGDDAAADAEWQAALELALLMAENEARFGDWTAALRALDSAQALTGALPAEWAQRRDLWEAELAGTPRSDLAG